MKRRSFIGLLLSVPFVGKVAADELSKPKDLVSQLKETGLFKEVVLVSDTEGAVPIRMGRIISRQSDVISPLCSTEYVIPRTTFERILRKAADPLDEPALRRINEIVTLQYGCS